MKKFYCNFLQILGFSVFLAFFYSFKNRNGVDFSPFINSSVKMYKDSNGVPNIQSENLYDVFFALGFAHAEDRLWSMYFSRKVALGEISELFGSQGIKIDKFARIFNFKKSCETSTNNIKSEEKRILQAYTNGINHYIDSTIFLPIEFYLFSINDAKWDLKSSCLVSKLTEYFLMKDFFEETMRSYLFDELKLDREFIEKILPFKENNFETDQTKIIKDEDIKVSTTDTPTMNQDQEIILKNNKSTASVISDKEHKHNNTFIKDNQSSLDDIMNKHPGIGSNGFVISGKLTKNSHPYLCNDPHLANSMPSLWYFANIKTSDIHLTGATIPGIPSIMIGSNGHLAWGLTNGVADTSDILRIEKKIVNEDKMEINFPDSKSNLKKRKEIIYFSTNKSKSASVTIEYIDSEFGPLINGHSESLAIPLGFNSENLKNDSLFNEERYIYILRSPFSHFHIDKGVEGVIKFQFSDSIEKFRENLSLFSSSLSIIFIDKHDNIGYQLTGKIPIRKINNNQTKDMEDVGAYIETITKYEDLKINLIPFYELPYVLNPECGYIITTNNIIINSVYKYQLNGAYFIDARSKSIESEIQTMIKNNQKINVDSINEKMLNNIKDQYCVYVLNLIRKIITQEKPQGRRYEGIYELLTFDCVMHGDSRLALIFNVFENEIYKFLYYPQISFYRVPLNKLQLIIQAHQRINYLIFKLKQYDNDFYRDDDKSKSKLKQTTNAQQLCEKEYGTISCVNFIILTYEKSIKIIKNELGENSSSDWKWKNLNVKHYPHKPFSNIPGLNILSHRTYKADGNFRTPKVSIFMEKDNQMKSVVSSNLKFLISLNNGNNSSEIYFTLDTGQSDRIFNPHYDDMMSNNEEGKLINFNHDINTESFTLEFRNK